jgi:hypothetical protein
MSSLNYLVDFPSFCWINYRLFVFQLVVLLFLQRSALTVTTVRKNSAQNCFFFLIIVSVWSNKILAKNILIWNSFSRLTWALNDTNRNWLLGPDENKWISLLLEIEKQIKQTYWRWHLLIFLLEIILSFIFQNNRIR